MKTEALTRELMTECERACEINESNLRSILSDNKNTLFGEKHGFGGIKTVGQFRESVPISDYSDYEDYIAKMRGGAENILTSYPMIAYCRTSGSSGTPKYIPVTKKVFERYPLHISKYKNSIMKTYGGKRFSVNAYRSDLNKPMGDETIFSEICYRLFYEKGALDLSEYAGGIDLMFVTSTCDLMYAKVWTALLCEDIVLFESMYLYELIRFFGFIEENGAAVLSDIRAHRVPETLELPGNIRSALLAMPASEERLRLIERELSAGFDDIALRLWPRLRMVSGVSNKAYKTEAELLKKYLGSVPRYYYIYCASECIIGAAVAEDDYNYVLIPGTAFFEFLPFDGVLIDGSGEALLPHELKVGELYEPILTNFAGLYRYRLGDVVKVTGYIGESPVMEFMFRQGQILNVAGEKITVIQLENVIHRLKKRGFPILRYCAGVYMGKHGGRYVMLIELSGSSGNAGDITAALDEVLALVNRDYDDLRKLGSLLRPEVITTDFEGFESFLTDQSLRTDFGHNKPRQIYSAELTEKKKADWKSYERFRIKA